MTNFNQTLRADGGQVVGAPKEVALGICEINYAMPGTPAGKIITKTVYDPVVYSDQQMAGMANDAAAMAAYQWTVGVF
ncbi:hypothetical protein ACA040_004643 [Xenophilus aerolatus]